MNNVKHTPPFSVSVTPFVIMLMLVVPFSRSVEAFAIPGTPTSNQERTKSITDILAAEIALARNQPEVALEQYLKASQMTADPSVAQQATLLAIQLEKPKEAIESATLWAHKAPNNLQAQLVAATLLIGVSMNEALPFLTSAIEIGPEDTDRQLAGIQGRLSDNSRKQLRVALQTIAKNKPQNAYAHLIAAHSAAQDEDIKPATFWVDSALKLNPSLTKAIELKARLIRFSDTSDTNALRYLSKQTSQNPNDAELRLFYGNALMDANRFEEAMEQLKQITGDKNFGGQASLLLGEYHLKTNQFDIALAELSKATSFTDTEETAHYLIAQLFEQQKKIKEAIQHYSAVTGGENHIPAFIRAATLLSENNNYQKGIELLHNSSPSSLAEEKQLVFTELDILIANKQLETAMTLADNVMPKISNDIDMRMKHSFVAEKLNQPKVAEMDLQVILKIDPNHTQALNALGLLLSNQKDREQEAIHYLSRALELDPNNPTYLDNLGWLYFKMGDTEKALSNLKKAHDKSSDANIAAHLGEVLKKQEN